MNFPSELKYSKSHEWVKTLGDGSALIGITDFAQDAMGDLVFINLPVVGDPVEMGATMCDIESVKAVSDVMSPLTGEIAEVNEALLDAPEALNKAPYESWIARVENITASEELLSAAEYEAFTQTL